MRDTYIEGFKVGRPNPSDSEKKRSENTKTRDQIKSRDLATMEICGRLAVAPMNSPLSLPTSQNINVVFSLVPFFIFFKILNLYVIGIRNKNISFL